MLTIYRTIFAENIEDIDTENFGNHWTFDECLDIDATNNGCDCEGTAFKFVAQVDEKSINREATMQSNADYPDEFECVVCEDTTLVVSLIQDYNDEKAFQKVSVDTGARIDEWVEGAESDTDWNTFIAEVKEWN